MKTAQRIGVLLLLAAISGCGSRKALTRTHYAERDSIMAITQKEVRNTRQCTGKQAEIIETFNEETTLMIRKDTTGLKLTRTVTSRTEHEKQPATRTMATDGHYTVPPETNPDKRERKGNSKA